MKGKIAKKVMTCALAAVMALGGTGFSSVVEAKEGSEEQITLNLWQQWTGTNVLKTEMEKAVADYEAENPNIKINMQTLDTDAYKTKMNTEFSGSAKGIDVFFYWGAGTAKKLVDAGKVLALDEYIDDEIKSKITEGSTAAFEYDGKLYSLPTYSWYLTLFCNKDIFDQAGAAIPTTYDEMLDAVDKINQLDGVTPIASGAKTGWVSAFWYQALALRQVGAEKVNAMLSGETEFSEEGYRQAAQDIIDMNAQGAFGANPLEQEIDAAGAAFGSGKAAMHLMGSWYANAVYSDETYTINPDKVVAVKIPMIEDGGSNEGEYCGGYTDSFWVNSNTEYPEEAAKLCIWLNERCGKFNYENGMGFTAWNSEVDESGLNPLFVSIKTLVDEGKTSVLAWDTSLASEPATIFNEQVQTLFSEDANADDFISTNMDAINNQ